MRHSMSSDDPPNEPRRPWFHHAWMVGLCAMLCIGSPVSALPQDARGPKGTQVNSDSSSPLAKCTEGRVLASLSATRQLPDVRGCDADSIVRILSTRPNVAVNRVKITSSLPINVIDRQDPISYEREPATVTLYVSNGEPPARRESGLVSLIKQVAGAIAGLHTQTPPPASASAATAESPKGPAEIQTPSPQPPKPPAQPTPAAATDEAVQRITEAQAQNEKGVSIQHDVVVVPPILGSPLSNADEILIRAGLKRGDTAYEWRISGDGRIFKQDPLRDTRVPRDSMVSVSVAKSASPLTIVAALVAVAASGWFLDRRRLLLKTKQLVNMRPRWTDDQTTHFPVEVRIHGKALALRPRFEHGGVQFDRPIRIAHKEIRHD